MGSKKKGNDKKAALEVELEDENGVKYRLKAQDSSMDKNFYKIYFPYFTKYLDGIINKKMKLVLWLIRNMTLTNELKYSYREIANRSRISYQTVAETMKILIKKDFIRRNGKTLMINPKAVFRGRIEKKSMAVTFFEALDKADTPKDEQKSGPSIADTKALNKELEELKEQKNRLQNKINFLELQLLFTDKKEHEDSGEDRNGTGQTSEQKPRPEEEKKDSAAQTSEQNPKPEEEKKGSTAQTSEQNPKPEEKKKDGTGQTSEQET